jgi:hypothetical protein
LRHSNLKFWSEDVKITLEAVFSFYIFRTHASEEFPPLDAGDLADYYSASLLSHFIFTYHNLIKRLVLK